MSEQRTTPALDPGRPASLNPSSETILKAVLVRLIRVQGPAGRAAFTADELARADQQDLDIRNDGHLLSLGLRWNT